MDTNRRKFLLQTTGLTAAALAGNLSRWGIEGALAQSASPYQAIVCVFLFGGNDSNNMLVPYTDYAQYAAVRTTASNVALTQAQLLQINAPSMAKTFGLHPSLAPIQTVYNAGKAAFVVNAGTLIRPMTKATFAANRPPNLFSHSDQQNAWQGLLPGAAIRTGWGGRAGRQARGHQFGSADPDGRLGGWIEPLQQRPDHCGTGHSGQRRGWRSPGRARQPIRSHARTP
jgi:uncharacterized protein (DUF1501 family)